MGYTELVQINSANSRFSDPDAFSDQFFPILVLTVRRSPHTPKYRVRLPSATQVATERGSLKTSCLVSMAHSDRAILFAKAMPAS
jgi:hypothetical protein